MGSESRTIYMKSKWLLPHVMDTKLAVLYFCCTLLRKLNHVQEHPLNSLRHTYENIKFTMKHHQLFQVFMKFFRE